MGRFARVVAVGVAHHITQRGNGKRYVLNIDADRAVYLGLLLENIKQHGASLLEYCLMSNHVHLVMIPDEATVWHSPCNIRTVDMPATGTPDTV